MVKKLHEPTVYEEVDLESDIEEQLPKLRALIRRATVFPSFAHSDHEVSERIIAALRAADFNVIGDSAYVFSDSALPRIDKTIGEAARHGFSLALISRAYLSGGFTKRELEIAIEKGRIYRSNVVPVVIEPDLALPAGIEALRPIILLPDQFEEGLPKLIAELKKRDME